MSGLHWWRVEVDETGKAIKVERGPKADDSGRVFYVEAVTQGEAERLAYNAYCNRKVKERRVQYASERRCRCGRKRDIEGRRTCSSCTERRKAGRASGRHGKPDAKEAGQVVRLEQHKRTVRDRRNELRLETLLEVRAALREQGTLVAFTHWLQREIKAAAQPRAAQRGGA